MKRITITIPCELEEKVRVQQGYKGTPTFSEEIRNILTDYFEQIED